MKKIFLFLFLFHLTKPFYFRLHCSTDQTDGKIAAIAAAKLKTKQIESGNCRHTHSRLILADKKKFNQRKM